MRRHFGRRDGPRQAVLGQPKQDHSATKAGEPGMLLGDDGHAGPGAGGPAAAVRSDAVRDTTAGPTAPARARARQFRTSQDCDPPRC
jgi:hypothetical protein